MSSCRYRPWVGLAVALACLWGVPRGARAAILFSQPPDPNGGLFGASFHDPDGMDGDLYPFDSFRFDTAQAITEVTWRGGDRFSGQYGAQPVIDFTITIYGSTANDFYPAVADPYIIRYQVGGNAGETPAGTFGGVPMYDYSYRLPAPFQAVAGKKYWIQIEASQTVYPNGWGIARGTGGDGQRYEAMTGGFDGGTTYRWMTGDVAYSLIGPDAATVTINASANPAAGGTVSGAGVYPAGSTVSLTAAPNAGYAFDAWTENGANVSTSLNYTFQATSDRTLVAQFVPAYTLTTNALPDYGGTTTGDGIYKGGASVTVTATPNPGFAFAGWSDYGTPVSADNPYTFAIDADRTLTADFALLPYTVIYDFDTGEPPLSRGMRTPLYQVVGGLRADFDSTTPAGEGLSIQSDASTGYKMSRFSGNYLWPNSVYQPNLEVTFDRPVTLMSFVFATADFHQTEIPTTIQLSAYADAAGTDLVGTTSTHGTYAGDTMPMGSLNYQAPRPFRFARVNIPYSPTAGSGFLVDNITVQAVPPAWTLADAATALKAWGGLVEPPAAEVARLDVDTTGGAGALDISDAIRLARKATGLDPG